MNSAVGLDSQPVVKMRDLRLRRSITSKSRFSRYSLFRQRSQKETDGAYVDLVTSHENDLDNCSIFLLDGTIIRLHVDKSVCTGQELVGRVAQHLDLTELEFFGVSYTGKDGYSRWLRPDKKVKSQSAKWVFEFRCRFYPLEPRNDLKYVTRYLLCCQVRQDVLAGRLPCSFESLARLGAYALQADYGNASQLSECVKLKGVSLAEYLKEYPVAPPHQQTLDLLERLCEIHQELDGLTPNQADCCFLDCASKMSMYGMQFYEAQSAEKEHVTLGNNANGIAIYRGYLRLRHYTWPQIMKVVYKQNKFEIRSRRLDLEDDLEKCEILPFTFSSQKLAKRCWQNVVENHQFFRLARRDASVPLDQSTFVRLATRRFQFVNQIGDCKEDQGDDSFDETHCRRSLCIRMDGNLKSTLSCGRERWSAPTPTPTPSAVLSFYSFLPLGAFQKASTKPYVKLIDEQDSSCWFSNAVLYRPYCTLATP